MGIESQEGVPPPTDPNVRMRPGCHRRNPRNSTPPLMAYSGSIRRMLDDGEGGDGGRPGVATTMMSRMPRFQCFHIAVLFAVLRTWMDYRFSIWN